MYTDLPKEELSDRGRLGEEDEASSGRPSPWSLPFVFANQPTVKGGEGGLLARGWSMDVAIGVTDM